MTLIIDESLHVISDQEMHAIEKKNFVHCELRELIDNLLKA